MKEPKYLKSSILAPSSDYSQITDYEVYSLSKAFDIFVNYGFLHKNHNLFGSTAHRTKQQLTQLAHFFGLHTQIECTS